MQQIEFGKQFNCPLVLCVGYFGCMHIGHVKLVDVARERANECGAKVALLTFDNNHLAVLGKEEKVLYTFDERLELYESIGVDVVITARFDENFRKKTGDEFVQELKRYKLESIVCGFDYSYGRDRQNAAALRDAMSNTCKVEIVEAVCINNVKVSTTLVKALLTQNKIEYANTLLSEPYFVCGIVSPGRHKGTEMGLPTANINVSAEKFLPKGVYGGYVALDGKKYRAVINVGQKPTFDLDNVNIEAHLIGYDGDLYNRKIKISLTDFLRQICKFDSEKQLIEQLYADKERVMND